MDILHMKPGQLALIEDYNECSANYKKRLMTFGLLKGVCITFKRSAPFGDPIIISVHGFDLALRKQEIQALKVKVLT